MYVIYARFSPRPNSQDCDSCDKQIADLTEWCITQQEAIRSVHRDEAISGAKMTRTGLSEAIRGLKRGDTIIVRDWDRLARKTIWQLEIVRQVSKRGAKLRTPAGYWEDNNDPGVKLLSTIMAAFAEFQREVTSMRTKRKMRKYVAEGRYMGGKAMFGYRLVDKCLVPDDEQQEVIKRVIALRNEGKQWVEIAATVGLDRNLVRRVWQRNQQGQSAQ